MTTASYPGDLTGKIIVVTGGAQGIGGAAAQLCAARGGTVIIADWKADTGQQAAHAIQAAGHCASFIQVDVRNAAAVESLMAQVQAQHGRLDVLICAAGIFRGAFQQPEELTLDDFDSVIDVNLRGVFYCVEYAMPLFDAAGGGAAILVGSGAGVRGGSGSIAYGASKGGVNGLGMTLERHLAARNVRVNVICPGGINTELKLGVVAAQAERAGEDSHAAVDTARNQLGTPDGVGRVIAFLASDEAAYMRGTLFTR